MDWRLFVTIFFEALLERLLIRQKFTYNLVYQTAICLAFELGHQSAHNHAHVTHAGGIDFVDHGLGLDAYVLFRHQRGEVAF